MYKQIRLVVILLLFVAACSKTEEAPQQQNTGCEVVYNKEIKSITESKCTISGCHDGASGLADLRTYDKLKIYVDNGKLKTYVVDMKLMPPATAPTTLTDEEREQVKCWIENNAPES